MVNMEVKGENYSEEVKKLILSHLFQLHTSKHSTQNLFFYQYDLYNQI